MVNRIRDGWPYGGPSDEEPSFGRDDGPEPDNVPEAPPRVDRFPPRERSHHDERLERIARDDYGRRPASPPPPPPPPQRSSRPDDWSTDSRSRAASAGMERSSSSSNRRGGGVVVVGGFVVGLVVLLVAFYQFGERQSSVALLDNDPGPLDSGGVMGPAASTAGWSDLEAGDDDGSGDVVMAASDGIAHSYDVVNPRALASSGREASGSPLVGPVNDAGVGEASVSDGPTMASRAFASPDSTDVDAAVAGDGTPQLWARAGALAAELQASYACSRFSVRATDSGAPALDGEVATSTDLGQARAALAEGFAGESDVAMGLGCTRDLGGGYLAVTNEREQIRLLSYEEVSPAIRAVLPEREDCAVVGWVVDSLPEVRGRLAEAGQAGFWVGEGDRLTLCQSSSGSWGAVEARGVDRDRGAALFYRGAVLAQDAGREEPEVGVGGPLNVAAVSSSVGTVAAPSVSPNAAPAAASVSLSTASSVAPSGSFPSSAAPAGVTPAVPGDAMELATPIAVSPLAGPTPFWPSGVASSGLDVSVVMQFTVGAGGLGSDFVVAEADSYDPAIIAAAVQLMEASRFPPPSATQGGSYRGVHQMVFRSPTPGVVDAPTLVSADPAMAAGVGVAAPPRAAAPPTTPSSVLPIWERNLTARDFERRYPQRAKRRNVSGVATLACKVLANRRPACLTISEDPAGWGFGAAAIELTEGLVARPELPDGREAVGSEFTWEFVFQLQD